MKKTIATKIQGFKVWFEELTPGEQLRTLACLWRLNMLECPRKYEKSVKTVIFRAERKRGNAELLKYFRRIKLSDERFEDLVYYFREEGKEIRGYNFREMRKRQQRMSLYAGFGLVAAGLGGVVAHHILKKKREGEVN